MNKFKFGLLAASALCASGFVALASPATARDRNDINISISLGNAAIGYNDGYYDQNRDWHAWRDDDERSGLRKLKTGWQVHLFTRLDDLCHGIEPREDARMLRMIAKQAGG